MGIKKKCAVLACALSTSLMASSVVKAEDVKGSFSILYSQQRTVLSAGQYLANPLPGYAPQLPIDHENTGNGYYGFQGEVNYGRYLLSVDYLTGTSKTVDGALDDMAQGKAYSNSFNPLTHETSEVLDLAAGYTVVENGANDKLAATLGYFRMWASPTISPPNWYDGLEIGVKGRYQLFDRLVLTGNLGYVPNVSVHGYMNKERVMVGDYLVHYTLGAEVPLATGMSIIGGYKNLRAENTVILKNLAAGSKATVKFKGFFVGGQYNF
jgi:hypothetical protein